MLSTETHWSTLSDLITEQKAPVPSNAQEGTPQVVTRRTEHNAGTFTKSKRHTETTRGQHGSLASFCQHACACVSNRYNGNSHLYWDSVAATDIHLLVKVSSEIVVSRHDHEVYFQSGRQTRPLKRKQVLILQWRIRPSSSPKRYAVSNSSWTSVCDS